MPKNEDDRLLLAGWWFVCGLSIVIALGIIWTPIVVLGIHRIFWEGPRGLFIEPVAFATAFGADVLWKRWSRARWTTWAYRRAHALDHLKARAMLDGVIPRDTAFLEAFTASVPAEDATG